MMKSALVHIGWRISKLNKLIYKFNSKNIFAFHSKDQMSTKISNGFSNKFNVKTPIKLKIE